LSSPVRFKKFYLAVARRYETPVLEEMASLGAVELIDAKHEVAGEAQVSDIYDRFLRMVQRCSTLLGSISGLKARFPDVLLSSDGEIAAPERPSTSVKITRTELTEALDTNESRLDALSIRVDKLLSDVESLSLLREKLSMLRASNVEANALGTRTFTVVKAGLVSKQSLPKLEGSLAELKAVHEVTHATQEDSLVSIVASKQQEEKLDDLLTKYGFQEIDLPPDLNPNPSIALEEVSLQLKRRLLDSIELEASLREIESELAARTNYVNFLKDTTTALARTKDLSVMEGWIVESAVQNLRQKVATVTSNSYYLEIQAPKKGEETPVLLSNRGWFLKGFELLTSIRGVPSYNELDPTIIFAVLFPIMYGMMFGDVGDGAVILVLGFLFYRRKKSFIGISPHALKSLGTIMMVGGVSAMVFGVAYGSYFLTQPFGPLLFEPISNFGTIVEVALAFGVAQLTISLGLNIRNHVSRGEFGEAVFSGNGAVGLAYYLLGMILAVRLIEGGLVLSLFFAPENLPFTEGALVCLLLVFLSPLIRDRFPRESRKVKEDVIDGMGEFVEVFISFLTNSLSYLRIAAFAIAHSIFASFAFSLGSTIGLATSLVLVNALVIIVDGFAAGIQSVRLLYYEFSTKFFSGAGQRFKPLSLKPTESS
jgi:V/A-type H+/Na+-transporting ATPase subunit I